MSLLIKRPSITNNNTMKRNSRSLDLSEITIVDTPKRQHQRSTSDSIANDIMNQVPKNEDGPRKQSVCSAKVPFVFLSLLILLTLRITFYRNQWSLEDLIYRYLKQVLLKI